MPYHPDFEYTRFRFFQCSSLFRIMSSSPTKAQGYNRSKPPPYTFASPVNSVFSSTSDESIITTSEISSEVDSPRVYDALPATVFVNHPSRSVHSSSTRRAGLPKLITGSTPTHTSFWEHPAIRDDLSKSKLDLKYILRLNGIKLTHRSLGTRLFSDRTNHLHTIFRLSADRFKPILDGSTDEVTRLATWWFIHGRMQLQAVIRDTSLERSQQSETQVLVRKAHTDISKALWILQEVFSQPLSSNIGKNATNLRNYQHLLLSKIGKTIESMGKHGLMPKDNSEAVFSPNNDGSIWIEYPSVGVDVSFLLTGCVSSVVEDDRFDTNLLEHMPLGTSESFFYYTALPVDVYIFNESSNSQQIKYPTLLSVVRARDDPQISMILASQDGQLNLCVKPENELKSTWDNVTWLDGICSLEVKLSTGFRLQIRCDELDFKTLSDMYQHHNNANTLFEPGMEEQVAFQTEIESVECRRTLNESLRPATDSAHHCRLRLFHRTITRAEGTGPRRMYRGSRLVILTPTTSKNLSVLEHQIWPSHVIEFGFLRGRNGQPTIFLRIDRNDPSAMTVLSFSTLEQCNTLLAHLTGLHLSEEEDIFAEAQLNSFSLAVGLEILGRSGTLGPSPWQRLRVINSKAWHESDPDVESCTTVLSESLRIVLDSPNTRLTDRLNLGIGELKIRRNVVASGHGMFFDLGWTFCLRNALKKGMLTLKFRCIRTAHSP